MNTGHFFRPGSDPTHKRPTRAAKIVINLARDPTRPDAMLKSLKFCMSKLNTHG